jgi:hypothetical protein
MFVVPFRLLWAGAPPVLSIGEDKQRGVFVKGAKHVAVLTPGAAMALLDAAEQQRTAAATEMNHASSRSHCVVRLTVERRCGAPIAYNRETAPHTHSLSISLSLLRRSWPRPLRQQRPSRIRRP